MAVKIAVDQLAEVVKKYLDEYGDEVLETVNVAARKTANNAKKQVASASPGTGKYAGSWAVKTERSRTGVTAIVYSKMPGLPHLLEHGHATRNGGRTRKYVHIAPAEESAVKEFQDQIERLLR